MGSDTRFNLPSQFVDSQSSNSLLLYGPHNQENFLIHISTIALSDVLTEWNPRVPWIVFHSCHCDQSTSTTSQKYICTCPFLCDWSSWVPIPSPIIEQHHSTMDFSSQTREVVVKFISFLCNALFMHALAP
jgi:hypothetical protein